MFQPFYDEQTNTIIVTSLRCGSSFSAEIWKQVEHFRSFNDKDLLFPRLREPDQWVSLSSMDAPYNDAEIVLLYRHPLARYMSALPFICGQGRQLYNNDPVVNLGSTELTNDELDKFRHFVDTLHMEQIMPSFTFNESHLHPHLPILALMYCLLDTTDVKFLHLNNYTQYIEDRYPDILPVSHKLKGKGYPFRGKGKDIDSLAPESDRLYRFLKDNVKMFKQMFDDWIAPDVELFEFLQTAPTQDQLADKLADLITRPGYLLRCTTIFDYFTHPDVLASTKYPQITAAINHAKFRLGRDSISAIYRGQTTIRGRHIKS